MECQKSIKDKVKISPIIMGILNVTPDSFYDGGKWTEIEHAIERVKEMIFQGAYIIDIGGMSSRPGADIISSDEELRRILPVLKEIKKQFSEIVISIDTVHSSTAEVCLKNGANVINDISGGQYDIKMYDVIAEYVAEYVVMHMKGTPSTMQAQTTYEDITQELQHYFSERLDKLYHLGIKNIVLDPGFGFSKTVEQNYKLLHDLELFKSLDLPLLVGFSRKSMIQKTINEKAENTLNGTTALNTIALMKGANILRVHDVKEAKEAIQLYNAVFHSAIK